MKDIKHHLKRITKRHLLGASLIGLLIIVVIQLFYPSSYTLPFAKVDGVSFGVKPKKEVANKLDGKLSDMKLPIYLSKSTVSYTSVSPAQIGLTIKNDRRVTAMTYPWYIRLVPTSLLWYGAIQHTGSPTYNRDEKAATKYLESQFGASCSIQPENADVTYKDGKLQLIKSKNGGTCDKSVAIKKIMSVEPTLKNSDSIRLEVKSITPKIIDHEAQKLIDSIITHAKGGVSVKVGSLVETIPKKDILSWLVFSTKNDSLTYSIDAEKSDAYFSAHFARGLTRQAGITRISTYDLTETARKNGPSGIVLDARATRTSLHAVLDGSLKHADVQTAPLAPTVEYTRSYSKTITGISALMQYYSQDHSGTFGVSFQEIGGKGRSVDFDGSRSFISASTYKLLVAYSTLKRIDSSKWKWSDTNISSGRNLSTCFDDMIVKSDNACAEAMLYKIGINTINQEIAALGLPNSGFKSDGPRTTADELSSFLIRLQNNQLGLKTESTKRLLDDMKRQVYRQGIPSGAGGEVADKVGFIDGLLHDAAIVYSPKGTYVLVIMTDGSSWANIAELTQKIEALR